MSSKRVRGAKRRAEPIETFADTSTMLEEIFDEDLLDENNIHSFLLHDVQQIATIAPEQGPLRSLLEDLFKATNAQLSTEEKQLLDCEYGDCDRILGPRFKELLGEIPEDNEGEWIAHCHNRLSELFRDFKTWKAGSVVSAVINEGVKPDRIFGFNFVPEDDYDAEMRFPGWYNTSICWPFLMIESKPKTYQKKVGDTWKMAIIEAFAVEQQTQVLKDLKVPLDSTYFVQSHLPISFGVYYVGHVVRISVYFILGQQHYFVQFPALSLAAKATNILKMFAIMKRYSSKMCESIMNSFSQRHWGNRNIPVNDNALTIEKANSESRSTSGGQSGAPVFIHVTTKIATMNRMNMKKNGLNLAKNG